MRAWTTSDGWASMTDEQFRVIRGLLVTMVILLGLITGILLALAWEYL
jgi:hypothetical protein